MILSNFKTSKFGSGYVMTGTHPNIKAQPIKWSETVAHIRSCSANLPEFSVNRVSIKPMQEYFAQDALGVAPPRRCGNCLNCRECGFRGQQLSQQEQYEYHELESRVRYDSANQCFHVSYPFTQDPNILPHTRNLMLFISQQKQH